MICKLVWPGLVTELLCRSCGPLPTIQHWLGYSVGITAVTAQASLCHAWVNCCKHVAVPMLFPSVERAVCAAPVLAVLLCKKGGCPLEVI